MIDKLYLTTNLKKQNDQISKILLTRFCDTHPI